MQEGSEYQSVTIQSLHRVKLPPPQDSLVLSISEWDALMNRVRAYKSAFRFWPIVYSVAFAVGVTAGGSTIAIAYSQLPEWVFTAHVSATALGVGVGIVAALADKTLSRGEKDTVDLLLADMERLKSQFIEEVGQGQ